MPAPRTSPRMKRNSSLPLIARLSAGSCSPWASLGDPSVLTATPAAYPPAATANVRVLCHRAGGPPRTTRTVDIGPAGRPSPTCFSEVSWDVPGGRHRPDARRDVGDGLRRGRPGDRRTLPRVPEHSPGPRHGHGDVRRDTAVGSGAQGGARPAEPARRRGRAAGARGALTPGPTRPRRHRARDATAHGTDGHTEPLITSRVSVESTTAWAQSVTRRLLRRAYRRRTAKASVIASPP